MCDQYLPQILAQADVQVLMRSTGTLEGRPFVAADRIRCVRVLPAGVAAGYMWRDGPDAVRQGDILLEAPRMLTAADVERSVKHELVHAFDAARGKIDPTDCVQQACSEIRAARLSGDCDLRREALLGNVGSSASAMCVQRRAALAVDNNPMCRGYGERAVARATDKCYGDFEPFACPPPTSHV